MQCSRLLVMSLLAAFAGSAAAASFVKKAGVGVGPVQKVLELLGSLEVKIVKDGEQEQKVFDAYAEWCRTGAADKGYEITTAKSDIEDLTATIDKAGSDIETSSTKISDLAASITQNEADLKAATGIRENEHKEFADTETELVDAIDTLERATNILERKLQGSALMQTKVNRKDIQSLIHTLSTIVDAAGLSLHDRQKLTALAQSSSDADDDADDVSAPAPQAYQSHGESIIDVLEDLKQKAETELTDVRRAEVNERHNYEMLKQSLEDQVTVDNKEMAEAKSMKADAQETKAVAEGDLVVTKKALADAKNVLQNMESDCAAAARDHEASVVNRAEELKALAAAMKALQEMTTGAVAVAYNGASLLQFSGQVNTGSNLRTRIDLANFEVVNLIRKLAKQDNSAALMQLAGRISVVMKGGGSTGEDPFAKVKTLISDMIERLVREGGEEAEHKAYCDKEMKETKQKMDELNYDLEKLGSKIDKAKARATKLKEEVATLQRDLAKLAMSQAEADKLRQEEHKVYVSAKSDLEQGLDGVRLALKVLRDYYATDSTAAAMFQQPDQPETHSAASGAGTSIIGMIEVVESDFGKALASAEIEEDSAAVAYQKVSMENRLSTAMKQKDVKYKEKEAAGLDKSATELSSDRDTAQTELDAVLDYSTNIRGMCIVKPESYEERTARRKQEIDGLKEALQILEGEAVLLQKGGRGRGLFR